MDPVVLRLWIKNYVTQMEIGSANPYQYFFPGGISGLSFGAMQNDVANSPQAYAAFLNILNSTSGTTGLTTTQIGLIMGIAATPGASSASFSADITDSSLPSNVLSLINTALADSTVLVNQADNNTLNGLMNDVNGALAAAANNTNGPGDLNASDPDIQFLGELAEWGNRTGGLSTTDDYLSGASVALFGGTVGGATTISQANYDANYLSQTKQFTSAGSGGDGEVLATWSGRVSDATTVAEDSLVGQGFYIPQSGDDASSIATLVGTDNSVTISSTELTRLNSATALNGSFSTDGLVYVPAGVATISTTPSTLAGPDFTSSEALVYDSPNAVAYGVGAGVGDGIAGTLYSLDSDGNATVFAPGTWKDVADSGDDSSSVIDLQDTSDDTIGSLSIIKAGGSNNITLTAGSGSPATETFSSTASSPVFVIRAPDGGDLVGQLGGAAWHVGTDGTISAAVNPFSDGRTLSDGFAALNASSIFSRPLGDPIVLDLSSGGTGVELTALADSSAYFDIDNTGFAIHTGWVGATTGILVNTTDPTNITNFFGSSSSDGFTALAALDTNHDGVINSSDSGFSSLYVWEDANGNGTVDSGEVQSLSSLGITSINLSTSPLNEDVNGNIITNVATYSKTGGGTGEVADAYFENTPLDSTFDGSYTLNPAALLLPDLKGYGLLPDLYVAMSMDSTLLDMVQGLATEDISGAGGFDSQIKQILYRWAGVDTVDPTASGANVNAQDNGFLQEYVGSSSTIPGTMGFSLGMLREGDFNQLFQALKAQLLVQGPLAPLFPDVSYDYDTDTLTGSADFSSIISSMESSAPGTADAAALYWATMAPLIDQIASQLGTAQSTYNSALETAFSDAGLPTSLDFIHGIHVLTSTPDGSGDNVFSIIEGTALNGDGIVTPDSPVGAIIEGGSGTNILEADEDISQAYISGIQTLDISTSAQVPLTADQLSGFSNLEVSGTGTLYATGAGTYSLSGKTITGTVKLSAEQTSSNVTLVANAGGSTLIDGSGDDTLTGGAGADTFDIHYGTSGTTVSGSSGSDTLVDFVGDISGMSVSGVETLEDENGTDTLTASELSGFSSLVSDTGVTTIDASGTGTYDISGMTTSGSFRLSAASTSANVTLIGNNQSSQTLTGGSGTDTLEAGNGSSDILDAGSGSNTLEAGSGGDILADGSGADTLTGGTGNDTFIIQHANSGTSVTGGGGSDALDDYTGDISNISISGVSTVALDAGGLKLTASEFSGFSSFTGGGTLYAANGGTYDLSGKTTSGSYTLSAQDTSSDVTLIGNSQNSQFIEGGAGSDTLNAGSGDGDFVIAGSGATTMVAGTGNDTLLGGAGSSYGDDTYQFGSGFGTDTVNNNYGDTRSTSSGEVDFLSGTTDEDLWFQQSGNDLQIDLLGTSDQITVSGWFSSAGNQVGSFTADGKTLDSSVASLVSAMATYASANPSFNPATAMAMPTDTSLQSAITSAWHT